MIFFLNWLDNNRITYKFDRTGELTELTIKGKYSIKLLYKYCVSIYDLQSIQMKKGLILVNLHGWNGGPYTSEAEKYATLVGARAFNQNKFFVFAHRNII